MNAALPFVHAWLLDLAMLTTSLLAAALALRTILRDAKSRVRLAWCTWLGIAAAALVMLLPGWPRYEFRALALATSAKPPALIADSAPALPVAMDWAVPANATPLESIHPPLLPPPIAPWRDMPSIAWMAAALAGLAWIALGAWKARRLLRNSTAAPDWIHADFLQLASSRTPRADVRTSTRLSSAVALRAHKPTILLPHASANPTNAKTIRAALAHEWAHIRHGDLWLLALERLLLPLLALHPLFWLLRRRTRLDQELLADVAAAGDKPVEYAEALVAWAKSSAPPPAALAALAFWDRPSNLTRRVHMILHKPRTKVTWFSRVLSFAALACLIALVGGLSLFTLRPLSADDEPAQSTPALVTDKQLRASPEAEAPVENVQAIELVCTVFEVDDAQVILTKDDQPKPPATLTHLLIDDWQKTSQEIQQVPGYTVISRPQLRTLNNRLAVIQIGQDVPPAEEPIGLTVSLLPEVLAFIDDAQQILLTVQLQRTSLEMRGQDGQELPIQVARRLQTKVAVPLGKTLLLVDPSSRDVKPRGRPLLLAIEPRLVAAWEETRPANPYARERLNALTQRLNEAQTQLAKRRSAVDSESRREAAALRHSLLRLQREIATLLEQTKEAASNPPAVANAQNQPPAKIVKVFQVQGNPAELQRQVELRMKDFIIDGVNFRVDANGLVVSGSEQQVAEVQKLLFELDRTSVATTERQLQQKLLELDLRESELGLQVAKAEHDQMAEIRKKNPGALSENELRHYQLKVDLAQVQVERMKVRLGAFQSASPPPTPANSKR